MLVVVTTMIALLSATVSAQMEIPGLWPTGVSVSGAPLAVGDEDPNYVLTSGPGAHGPTSLLPPHPAWTNPPLGTSWVGPAGGDDDALQGTYTYELEFDITGLDPATAVIEGLWSVDDSPVSVRLNGTTVFSGSVPLNVLVPFAFTSGFVYGVNHLSIDVDNCCTSGDNPTGLLIAAISGTASPSPQVWFDEGCALAGVAGDPSLTGSGPLAHNTLNELQLTSAAPSAPTVLFLSLSSQSVNFKGGTLKAFPFIAQLSLSTNAAGSVVLPFLVPPSVPGGTDLWLQWAVLDPAAIRGVALSNALRGSIL